MNHDYISHTPDIDKCEKCGYSASLHGDLATCECCDKVGRLEIGILGNRQALLHPDCVKREREQIEKEINDPNSDRRKQNDEYQSEENQQSRLLNYNKVAIPYDNLISNARKLDEQLHLSSDIFTAKTVPIEEVRKAIWRDDSIPMDRKFFEYVAECKRRITLLQGIIFDLDKKKIEAYSEQKAWHVSMNDYANKLRADEREQLRITDVTYDVKMPKTVTPKAIKVNSNKVSKTEMREAVSGLCKELGKEIPEYMVSMLMVSKGWTLEQTINHLRRSLKEGLSEVTTKE